MRDLNKLISGCKHLCVCVCVCVCVFKATYIEVCLNGLISTILSNFIRLCVFDLRPNRILGILCFVRILT